MAVPSSSAVQVSNSAATTIFTPKNYSARVTIQNLGPNAIYVGSSAVTTATGLSVPANGSFSLSSDWSDGPLYAIAATAAQSSPADTRVFVEPLT